MAPSGDDLRPLLTQLVQGMTGLRHDGRFMEPNLDGTAGDYISFDSWEWPQGVGLYGLVRLWQHSRDDALRHTIEEWYLRRLATGLPAMNINTTAPMLALSLPTFWFGLLGIYVFAQVLGWLPAGGIASPGGGGPLDRLQHLLLPMLVLGLVLWAVGAWVWSRRRTPVLVALGLGLVVGWLPMLFFFVTSLPHTMIGPPGVEYDL